jgi:hypothetical protein
MRVLAAVFSLLLLAQSGPNRTPNGGAYADRLKDNIRAQQMYEAAGKGVLTPRQREAIAKYEPSSGDLLATWGDFITAQGEPFVALQLAGASLTAGEKITLFGVVVDEGGKTISTYNEPAVVAASKSDLYVERSLISVPRKGIGTFGLARRNDIVAMTRVVFEPEELAPAAPGISRLIVSGDVHVLEAAQRPLDPFAFGGTKVVPKPGAAFRKTDEVWLFTELRNPSLGGDGVPHVITRVDVDGPARIAGKPVPAEATPLKGVPGHYGIGNTVDVAPLAPGRYRVRVTIMDAVAKQSFQRETTLTIVE